MTPAETPLRFLGTWKLVGCETSHPGLPHPQSSVTTFAQEGNGVGYHAETNWSDGRTTAVSTVFALDGSWCPLTGSALADSVSLRVLDDGSFEGKMKKGESDSGSNHMTVSADGQTMTTQWNIVGPGGVAISWKTTAQRK